MSGDILAVLELRIKAAKKKVNKYAMDSITARNVREKCQNEIELAYYLGKAEAYMEIKGILLGSSYVTVELRELIERAAEEVLESHVLEYLNGVVHGTEPRNDFEDGVEALKQQLIRLIDPQSIEINVVARNENQEQQKDDKDGFES
ncbi:hypothetical protein [Thermococcus sp.]|uniref:hypothetical protein n=1 Tax=Thermococcus sp. TaxID=35749 RepID=UPI00260FD5E7|nr:hypothetical protein [Thermococcus sp.]